MNSSKRENHHSYDSLLANIYSAENIDSLLIAIRHFLNNLGLVPHFSIAFRVPSCTELTVKHRYDSLYKSEQAVFCFEDNQGCFWVSENTNTPLVGKVSNLKRCVGVPLFSDNELTGCLILEKHHIRIDQESANLLSLHLTRNLARIELNQLYTRQHQHDVLKLSSIDRMKTIMRELDLHKVLTGLIELTLSTVSGSAACFVLNCAQEGELKTSTEYGVTLNEMESLIHREYGPIADYITLKQQAWLTCEREEFFHFSQSPFLDRLNAFLILPIVTRDGLGCLFIADPENITENALETATTIVQFSRISIDNALLHTQVVERAIHKQQLEIAGEVQNSLMPEFAPRTDGVKLFGLNLPCDDAGGDYYDFIELPDKRLCFVLADATGHGIGAAILATTARAMLRALLQEQPEDVDLASICSTLNNLLDSDLATDKFITMFIGIYNPFNKTLFYASAGHDPPLMMYQPEQNTFSELECTGLPFGMLPNMDYEVSSPIQLKPDTILFLSSDGVPEAINDEGQMYGKERVKNFIRKNAHNPPDKICHAIVDDVTEFRHSAQQSDDITIVTICVDPDST